MQKPDIIGTMDAMISDLVPGDFVQHPEEGVGVVAMSLSQELCVYYVQRYGYMCITGDLANWERVEIVKPGHVQISVDDLDLSGWEGQHEWKYSQYDNARVAIRVTKAIAAQRAEKPTSDDDKPTSTTVTLFCPDCGEALPKRHCRVTSSLLDGKWVTLEPNAEVHICQPSQPDEPTEFGARVTVAGDRLLRVGSVKHAWPWQDSDGRSHTWNELTERGTVTLGWEDES